MNRRELIKGITAVGAIAILPSALSIVQSKKQTHFVGLGDAGTKAVELFFTKGVEGKFTCISDFENEDQRPGIVLSNSSLHLFHS